MNNMLYAINGVKVEIENKVWKPKGLSSIEVLPLFEILKSIKEGNYNPSNF